MAKSQDGIEVVHLNGDLDYQNAQELKKQLTDLVAAGHPRLVIDLAAVSSIDSSG
ncbi:MAG: STAS domain-containing protein, partial [Chloroflexota bacterium]